MPTATTYYPQTAQIPAESACFYPRRSARSAEISTRDPRRFPRDPRRLSCGDVDGPMRPHTYGVRSRMHTSSTTEPCSLTACVRAGSLTVVGIPNSSLLIPNWIRHPDHLGSSSWITYTDGSAVQHLHYLPWGEDFVDQRLNSFDGVRYTFSAKEKDTETGYSYFGARYYSSDLSIWLSVDPMSDKYPSTSPYAYCRNNPVVLFDPNGMFDDWVMDKYGVIYWDENAKDQSTTKFGEQYLGRAGQRSYGTAVINYKSNRTWSFMNPVEISSNSSVGADMATSVPNSTVSGVVKKVTGWVCGNGERLNGGGFCASNGGGLFFEAVNSSETISKTADELLATNIMGKVAKTAKRVGYAGEAINMAVAISNYYQDPTGYNLGKLIVTTATTLSNGLNCVAPGLGTAVSIGLSIIDVNGGFDWFYNKLK